MEDELEDVFKKWEQAEKQYKFSIAKKKQNVCEKIGFTMYILSLQRFINKTNYPSIEYAIIMHFFYCFQTIIYGIIFVNMFSKVRPIYILD